MQKNYKNFLSHSSPKMREEDIFVPDFKEGSMKATRKSKYTSEQDEYSVEGIYICPGKPGTPCPTNFKTAAKVKRYLIQQHNLKEKCRPADERIKTRVLPPAPQIVYVPAEPPAPQIVYVPAEPPAPQIVYVPVQPPAPPAPPVPGPTVYRLVDPSIFDKGADIRNIEQWMEFKNLSKSDMAVQGVFDFLGPFSNVQGN
jgi:hypothetical protein